LRQNASALATRQRLEPRRVARQSLIAKRDDDVHDDDPEKENARKRLAPGAERRMTLENF
jgi:hypothetical protein